MGTGRGSRVEQPALFSAPPGKERKPREGWVNSARRVECVTCGREWYAATMEGRAAPRPRLATWTLWVGGEPLYYCGEHAEGVRGPERNRKALDEAEQRRRRTLSRYR